MEVIDFAQKSSLPPYRHLPAKPLALLIDLLDHLGGAKRWPEIGMMRQRLADLQLIITEE